MQWTFKLVWATFVCSCSFALFIWFVFSPPIPGVAIAALAALAVLMTLVLPREPKTFEKIMWMVGAFALMFIELLAITHDRTVRDIAERTTRDDEQTRFDNTISDLDKILFSSNQVLQSTNNLLRLEDEARRAEERHATSQLAEIRRQLELNRIINNNDNRAYLLNILPRIIAQMQDLAD